MPLDHLALDRITEADLQALIGTPEGRDIEFKLETWGDSPEAKREFLADISSLANTLGGHIIVGMREDPSTKLATELVGVEIVLDKEQQRLESCALTGLQPRLFSLRIRAVSLANGRKALILRIPRSFNPPHRVIRDNSNRFWARHTAGKYEPDVDQLRELFAVAPTLAERIRDFRFDRLAKIRAGDSPLHDLSRGALILHVLPSDAFARTSRFSVGDLFAATSDEPFEPLGFGPNGYSGRSKRPNLEGLLVTSGPGDRTWSTYAQIWRAGQVEAARSGLVLLDGGQRVVPVKDLERDTIAAIRSYAQGLHKLEITPPYEIFVTLLGVRDAIYGLHGKLRHDDTMFAHDAVPTTAIQMTEPLSRGDQALATLLRPAFDEIANAAGRFASPHFDTAGHWVPGGP